MGSNIRGACMQQSSKKEQRRHRNYWYRTQTPWLKAWKLSHGYSGLQSLHAGAAMHVILELQKMASTNGRSSKWQHSTVDGQQYQNYQCLVQGRNGYSKTNPKSLSTQQPGKVVRCQNHTLTLILCSTALSTDPSKDTSSPSVSCAT